MRRIVVTLIAVAAISASCSSSDGAAETSTPLTTSAPTATSAGADAEQMFPDVIAATATPTGNGTWTFSATISSPYDTASRYADGWRVLDSDGTEYGFRLLTHDHASEQPFTRLLADVEIPAEVESVIIEGRDQKYGFGGATVEVALITLE